MMHDVCLLFLQNATAKPLFLILTTVVYVLYLELELLCCFICYFIGTWQLNIIKYN